MDKLEKIGRVELENYTLGVLAPAHTIEDIYSEIMADKEIWGLSLKDTYYLIKNRVNRA